MLPLYEFSLLGPDFTYLTLDKKYSWMSSFRYLHSTVYLRNCIIFFFLILIIWPLLHLTLCSLVMIWWILHILKTSFIRHLHCFPPKPTNIEHMQLSVSVCTKCTPLPFTFHVIQWQCSKQDKCGLPQKSVSIKFSFQI